MSFLNSALDGARLTRTEALDTEHRLILEPGDLKARANLIGYYFAHYYCCQQARFRRMEHIVWAIEHVRFLPSAIGPLMYVHLVDRDSFEAINKALERRLTEFNADADYLALMASIISPHNPQRAEELYRTAVKQFPTINWLNEAFERFGKRKNMLLSNTKKFKDELTDQYFSGEACNGDPHDQLN